MCNITTITTTSRPITTSPTRFTTRRPTTTSSTTPSWRPTSCVVPPQPQNGFWKLHKSQCCNNEQDAQTCDHCDLEQGTRLERGAYLIYNCTPGYKIRGSPIVFCGPKGTWLNTPVCTGMEIEPRKCVYIIVGSVVC